MENWRRSQEGVDECELKRGQQNQARRPSCNNCVGHHPRLTWFSCSKKIRNLGLSRNSVFESGLGRETLPIA
eukprot:750661-Rhodomonas_salina.2